MKKSAFILLALLMPLLSACSEPNKPSIALYLALQRGDLDQLERHIHWGSDIDALLPNGQYPLHVAAENGRVIMLKTLLKNGASVERLNHDGNTALEVAALAGRIQIAELLLAQGAELDASALLLKAATAGVTDRDAVRFLVTQGADMMQRNAEGDTALLIAIRHNNHRLANHLVHQGADVNVQTADGRSALSLARALEEPTIGSLLERYGALATAGQN